MDFRHSRRTKIIATMGPACRNEATLAEFFRLGVNVIRLNFSHGSHEEHAENIKLIRRVAAAAGVNPGILLDLQGPKIRTGEIQGGAIEIAAGDAIAFTPDDVVGTRERVSISYERLAEDIKPGNRILIDDGLMDAVVEEIRGRDVVCRVGTGGTLKPHKGVNFPGAVLGISPITEKDKEDLYFGIDSGIDFVALSFVRSAAEVVELKKIIHQYGVRIPVVAKIEKEEAVKAIDSIIDAADAIMVARGDLAVETLPEEVPLMQKMIAEKCNIAGKPVIIATQMLESMIANPRPTRAEATDVATAVFDGADAVMLSGETAAGKHPAEAVSMMDRIARNAERVAYRRGHFKSGHFGLMSISDAVAHSIADMAANMTVKFIVAFTFSGNTAMLLSKYRSSVPILAMTHTTQTIRQLALYWGVEGMLVPEAATTDGLMEIAATALQERNLVRPLDIVVVSAGMPLGASGTTNMLRVLQFPKDTKSIIHGRVEKDGKAIEWAVDEEACIHCGMCESICSCGIYTVTPKVLKLNTDKLKDCFFDLQCVHSCPVHAIRIERARDQAR